MFLVLTVFGFFKQRMSTVVMQSLAYVQHSSSVPGAKLFIDGDLRLQQRTPLPHRGLYNIYNVSQHLSRTFFSPPVLVVVNFMQRTILLMSYQSISQIFG